MFPLGTVLLPSAVLPLHIFEPRYRAMISDCVATQAIPDTVEELLAAAADETAGGAADARTHTESSPFGVVLIERGSEVGGQDTRHGTGCLAQILEAQQESDGRWHVMSVGTRRFTVTTWLQDDPYPVADIEVLVEPEAEDGDLDQLGRVVESYGQIGELARDLGRGGLPDLEIAADPALASFQLAALGPLGPVDRLDILRAATPTARLSLLEQQFTAVVAMLTAQRDE